MALTYAAVSLGSFTDDLISHGSRIAGMVEILFPHMVVISRDHSDSGPQP